MLENQPPAVQDESDLGGYRVRIPRLGRSFVSATRQATQRTRATEFCTISQKANGQGKMMTSESGSITLATPVQYLPGVGTSRGKRLARLGLRNAQDLLFLFPRDYERPAPPTPVSELVEGQPASLVGTITDAEIVSRTPGKSVFGAIVENESGAVRLLFFQPAVPG